MPSPEKFNKTLLDFSVSIELVEKIYAGYEGITDKTARNEKSAFFSQAISLMNEFLSEEQVKEILESNACCKGGVREKNSKGFARINKDLSIEERLESISQQPRLNMGRAELDEQGFLIVHGVAYQLGGRFECACPTVGKVKRDQKIPKEYCYCCGGHFKYHYEIMLDVKLELIEVVSSPHDTDGGKPCVFKYRIL
jgi:hypothetical protein